jgi:hypothetical protein
MEGKGMNIRKRFIPGKGWEITEEGAETEANPSQRIKPGPVQLHPTLSPAAMAKILTEAGMVVMTGDDHRELLATITELERRLDHAAETAREFAETAKTSETAAEGKSGKGKGKEKLTPAERAEVKAQIAAAATLEELTEVMKEVEDKELLKLGELRAEQITQPEGGQ